ncbi:MAG TPA: magnesium transporter CorA family protein [Thermomicrobiales bacterium]|nr:magnesium transporter CorA family protein [Thermomicrobiales bacterium]
MATIHLCLTQDGTKREDVTLESLQDVLDDGVSLVWVDADADDETSIGMLQRMFGLHALAVEDALDRRQRAKYRLYDDMLYLEFYGLELVGEEIEPQELAMFVGENYVITVRHDGKPTLDGIHKRWRDQQINALSGKLSGQGNGFGANGRRKMTPMRLVYTILDEVVDNYFPAIEWLGEQISNLEDIVLEDDGRMHQVEIHRMRAEVFRVRRLLSPEQEVLNMLLRRDVPMMEDALLPYFADIHDHVLRVQDWTESYRDQLMTIADIQMSMQSQRLDRTVRTLTTWSIILMVCGIIAGIYGMNFTHMPELGWRLGYPLALGMMAAAAIGLGVYFRRRDWW